MVVGIMQPYIFPYLGYFQHIRSVDTFVIYDDVQYITRGWINRNRILQNGEPNLFTFSLQNDSSRKNINERYFIPDFSTQCEEFLKMIQFAYGSAPYFKETKKMIKSVFDVMNPSDTDENIAEKIGRSIKRISDYLELKTAFKLSSGIKQDHKKSGQERILAINQKLGSDTYINPVNGRELYDHKRFEQEQIKLKFIEPKKVEYTQFSEEFIPRLSIIDVCMFNDKEELTDLLASYSLTN